MSNNYNVNIDQNNSVIAIRLNTNDVIQKVQDYLTGMMEVITPVPNGEGYYVERKEIGAKKMNPEGIQSFLGYLTMVFSSQTVQGNFKEERWEYFICRIQQELAYNLLNNAKQWGIDDNDIEWLISQTVNTLALFFSRTIGDGERESYKHTFKSEERNIITQNPNDSKTGLIK